MLKSAYLVAKIGADTAENEQHFAEILPIGRRVADRCPRRARDAREEAREAAHRAAEAEREKTLLQVRSGCPDRASAGFCQT